jgi:hypothetical protein
MNNRSLTASISCLFQHLHAKLLLTHLLKKISIVSAEIFSLSSVLKANLKMRFVFGLWYVILVNTAKIITLLISFLFSINFYTQP